MSQDHPRATDDSLAWNILDHIPAPVGVLEGPDWRLVHVNPALEALGSGAFRVGARVADVWPHLSEGLIARFSQVLAGGAAHTFHDMPVPQRSGGMRYFTYTLQPFRRGSGAPQSILCTAFDTTQHVKDREAASRAAHALSEHASHEALLAAMANLPIGVAVVELGDLGDPRIVSSNEAYQRIMGNAPELPTPFRALPWSYFLPDRVTPMPVETLPGPRAARTGEPAHEVEIHLRDPSGAWRVLSISSARVANSERPRRAISVVLDVTQAYDGVRALKQSEQRFRALIERSSDVTLVVNAEGIITFANPSVQPVLGYTPEELVGRPIVEFTDPERRAHLLAARKRVLASPGVTVRLKERLRRKDGTWALLEGERRNLVDVPGVEGIVINNRDVTQEERMRHEFQQAQKLESVGRLAGGVAHDFNNLLTVIMATADALSEVVADRPRGVAELELLQGATRRAADLTRQLLAFSRSQMLQPQRLDLTEAVRAIEPMLRRLLGEHIALAVVPAAAPLPVEVDPGQLEQVIVNLCVNARDAMPRGGALTLKTSQVQLTADTSGPLAPGLAVALDVIDSGTGMNEETLARLFEPFFTTKERGRGTGLGLATSFGIARQSGGDLRAHSQLGVGSTFRLLLPALDPKAWPAPPPSARSHRANPGEHVLLVEDDAAVQNIVAQSLSRAGYEVSRASSVEAALEFLADTARPVNLVLSDVVMEGQSGADLARTLTGGARGFRVLLMSGYTNDVLRDQGALPPGVTLLPKPFAASTLLRSVREALDAEPVREPGTARAPAAAHEHEAPLDPRRLH